MLSFYFTECQNVILCQYVRLLLNLCRVFDSIHKHCHISSLPTLSMGFYVGDLS